MLQTNGQQRLIGQDRGVHVKHLRYETAMANHVVQNIHLIRVLKLCGYR